MIVGLAVLVWILSGLLIRALNSGEVLSGTSLSGVELGGQTRTEAEQTISEIPPRRIRVRADGQAFPVRAPQAGLVVDAGQSAEQAYSAGRSGIGSWLKPLLLNGSRDLDPSYKLVREKRLNRTVNRISDEVDRDPFVGALTVDPSTLEVTAEQPEAGVKVRREDAKEQLVEAIETGESSMRLPTRTLKAPTQAKVEEIADEAERYLEAPVRIRTAGGPAEFTPAEMSSVLAIESTDPGIRLGINQEAASELVGQFAGSRDIAARDAGLVTPATPPASLTTQGDVSWQAKQSAATVTPSKDGRQIRQKKAVANLGQAVREGEHVVRFPSEKVEPEVTTKQMRGATSLIGTFTTSYPCCEPRVTNIQQIAKKVDGTVVAPGAQFSLNEVAGERTKANGYKPAPTIGENNELIDTIGGGVSQFSTTLYNAAYFAGLQIDSHTPHSFYISRYPAGRESTLNYGSIDLLWTNDTGSPVVVRSAAGDTSVTVSLYGDNEGRKVRADTQSRSKNSQGGFDITIDRVVTGSDGTTKREPFTTSYGVAAE